MYNHILVEERVLYKHQVVRYIVRISVTFFVLVFMSNHKSKAQYLASYVIGYVHFEKNASTPSVSSLTTYSLELVSGTAAYFQSDFSCIRLSNGIVKFLPFANGVFVSECANIRSNNNIKVNLYPNPAKGFTVIQSLNITPSNKGLQIRLADELGRLLNVWKISQDQLIHGYLLSLDKFYSGGYFISVYDENDVLMNTQKLLIIK